MSFDPIGTIVDWLDLCRAGNVPDLVALYDSQALHMCGEEAARGYWQIRKYWENKLANRHPDAFQLQDVALEAGRAFVVYRNFDGKLARSSVEFNESGQITEFHCVCSSSIR